jgi:hypothetical protein
VTERPLSPRVERYVIAHYPGRVAEVIDLLQSVELPQIDRQSNAAGRERVQAAMLAYAHDDVDRLIEVAVLAETDWRDVLMADARFAHEGWEDHVTSLLGPAASRPHD